MIEDGKRPNLTTLMGLEPRTKEERDRNISIANGLRLIMHIKNRGLVGDRNFMAVLLNDPANPLHEIAISENYTLGEHIPEGFALPAVAFQSINHALPSKISAEHDDATPSHVLAPDGKLYFLSNIYTFNSKGQAIKRETPFKSLVLCTISDIEKENLPKIDFVPTENDAQFALLNIQDYARIRTGIIKIMADRFQTIPGPGGPLLLSY